MIDCNRPAKASYTHEFATFSIGDGSFFLTILTGNVPTGAMLGVTSVVLCYLFRSGSIIEYIPLCLPLVLSQHLYGYETITVDSYSLSWSLLAVTFVAFLAASVVYLSNKQELSR